MTRSAFLVCMASLCLCAVTAHAAVPLVEDRLSMDALVRADWRLLTIERGGWSERIFEFYRRNAFVGLTGYVSPVVSLRICFDAAVVSGRSASDLYVDLHWSSGFGLRAGQFKLPLGFEALTDEFHLKFIDYSLVKRSWKPANPRDVGVLFRYDTDLVGFSAAVVNGNGINQSFQDNNEWKDIAGRIVFRPLARHKLSFAGRGYYGRMGKDEEPFENIAGELQYSLGSFEAGAEFQHAWVGSVVRTSFYVQASSRLLGLLEPVARFHMELQEEDRYDLIVTGGLNFRIIEDRLKVMTGFDYHKKESNNPDLRIIEQELQVQLQAAI